MTATRHVTIWCDAGWCSKWTDHGERTITETRRLAKMEGWIFTGTADYCCAHHALGERTRDEQEQEAYEERQRRGLLSRWVKP